MMLSWSTLSALLILIEAGLYSLLQLILVYRRMNQTVGMICAFDIGNAVGISVTILRHFSETVSVGLEQLC